MIQNIPSGCARMYSTALSTEAKRQRSMYTNGTLESQHTTMDCICFLIRYLNAELLSRLSAQCRSRYWGRHGPPQSPLLPPPYPNCQGQGHWRNATCSRATVFSIMTPKMFQWRCLVLLMHPKAISRISQFCCQERTQQGLLCQNSSTGRLSFPRLRSWKALLARSNVGHLLCLLLRRSV